jgi:hypothetical protein
MSQSPTLHALSSRPPSVELESGPFVQLSDTLIGPEVEMKEGALTTGKKADRRSQGLQVLVPSDSLLLSPSLESSSTFGQSPNAEELLDTPTSFSFDLSYESNAEEEHSKLVEKYGPAYLMVKPSFSSRWLS